MRGSVPRIRRWGFCMGRLASGLLVGTFAVGLALAACSADGTTTGGDFSPTEPEKSQPLPPSMNDDGTDTAVGNDGGSPSQKKDAGQGGYGTVKDGGAASRDAGRPPPPPPPAPQPGESCSRIDDEFEIRCGRCGKHKASCEPAASGTGSVWSEYGACVAQTGVCAPGDLQPCGNCGTRTCTGTCGWPSACLNEPSGPSCPLGAVELTTAGCGTIGTYKRKVCQDDCTPALSSPCIAPPSSVNVAPNPGNVTYTVTILTPTQTAKRLFGSCPSADLAPTPSATSITVPIGYVQVNNPHPKPAKVQIYNSVAPDGLAFETTLTAYAGSTIPVTDAERQGCSTGPSLTTDASITGNTKSAYLPPLTIPAGGSIMVATTAKKAFDSNVPETTTGPVKVVVKTIRVE